MTAYTKEHKTLPEALLSWDRAKAASNCHLKHPEEDKFGNRACSLSSSTSTDADQGLGREKLPHPLFSVLSHFMLS